MIHLTRQHFLYLFLGLFIFLSLLFPVYYGLPGSPYAPYYAEFSFSVLFAGLTIFLILLSRPYNKEHKSFVRYLILLLVLYNLASAYINFTHSRWLWESFNVSLAALLFAFLLLCRNDGRLNIRPIVPFVAACQLLAIVLAIITYFLGYTSVSLLNGQPVFTPHDPSLFNEKRFSWLYYHKSQYCFVLLLFIGFFFAYRRYFKNRLLFLLCNIGCFACIFLSHAYTALLAGLIIIAGYSIDSILPTLKKNWRKYLLFSILPLLFLLFVIYKIAQERNIWTLGSRTYIWAESVRQILRNPLGIGTAFGPSSFPVPGIDFEVYNCHNVFLNEMYRFSLPVGLLFTLLFFSILVYSLKKHFSFLNLGIWAALLLSLNMDYALLGRELTITFFYLYAIFFLPYQGSSPKIRRM